MERDEKIQIIANESNTLTEVEAGSTAHTAEPSTTADKVKAAEQLDAQLSGHSAERSSDEVATNDGTVVETLDTAFHNKPGVAEGENLSGSDRADYYEVRSQGKTDAEEELDTLNKGEQV